MDKEITFFVNDQEQKIVTDTQRLLLEVLREDLKLTGTNYGCKEGLCGACTVLIDDEPNHSCMVPIEQVEYKWVTTIEGLAQGDKLHPVQQAFLEEEAFQCGYCTPGMILNTIALLNKYNNPTDEQIIEWMNGNICRCNGYPKIISAIRRAAKLMSEDK